MHVKTIIDCFIPILYIVYNICLVSMCQTTRTLQLRNQGIRELYQATAEETKDRFDQ